MTQAAPKPARPRQQASARLEGERLELALHTTSDGLFVWDLDTNVATFSPRFRELLGYDDEAEFDRVFSFRHFLHPSDATVAAFNIRSQRDGSADGYNRDYRMRHKSGAYRWFHVRGRFMRSTEGRLTRLTGAITDITARIEAEAALRAGEQRFRELMELSADWFWEQDEQFRFVHMNGQAGNDSTSTPDMHLGKARWELPFVDMSEQAWQQHREQLQRHEPFRDFEIRRLDDQGQLNVFLTSGRPIFDAEGRFTGYRGVGRDVTPLHQAEQRRSELETQLRESQKMQAIGTLAGGIAHDFNNILGALFGNLVLARQLLAAQHPATAHLAQIERSAERARALVRQILTFSHQDDNRLPRQAMDVQSLVGETLALLRATLPASVTLDRITPDEPVLAVANPDQLHQVLMNLCLNAWHAVNEHQGRISVELKTVLLDRRAANRAGRLAPGSYAQLTVSDNGCGMDEATRARIFEPFFTTRPVGQGTGLGLAVVHGVVQAHRGAIQVRSRVGRGSSFVVWLPSSPTPVVSDMGPPPAADPGAGKGRHVLYIDDDEVMTLVVEGLLVQAGYRATVHVRANEALAALRAQPQTFDLVVTDFHMPDMSGLDVARAVAEIRPDLPVMISSGHLSDELRQGAQALGVHELMPKEDTAAQLLPRIRALLDGAAALR